MKLTQKLSTLYFSFVAIVITGFYLFDLRHFPIFADEAIYLHWVKRISLGDESPFISLFDGKTPLFIWLSLGIYALKLNLLTAGRLVSVFSLISLLLIVFQTLKKINLNWAWLAVILISLNPFIYFHARLALMDMLLTSLLIAAILAWSTLHTHLRAPITGTLLGLGFLAKLPALFLFPLPFVDLITQKLSKKIISQIVICIFIAIIFILTIKNQIWFSNLFSRSQDFSYSIGEVFSGQTDQIMSNLKILFVYLGFYLSWPIIFLSFLAPIIAFRKKQPIIYNILTSFLLFSLPFIIVGKVIYSRYYLLSFICVLLLSAYTLSKIPKKIQIIIMIGIIVWELNLNFRYLADPRDTHLTQTDQNQYLMDWSSGIGVSEAADFFRLQAKTKRVKVLTEGSYGTLPDGLFVYLDPLTKSDNLEIIGVGSPDSRLFEIEAQKTNADILYYIGNENRVGLVDQDRLKLVVEYAKLEDGPPLQIYKITPME